MHSKNNHYLYQKVSHSKNNYFYHKKLVIQKESNKQAIISAFDHYIK